MKTQGSEPAMKDAWQRFEKAGKWNKYQAVLKAVWEDERMTAAISHMDTFEKLRENVAAALDRTSLTEAEKGALERYAAATRSYACDGCDHLCDADGKVVMLRDHGSRLLHVGCRELDEPIGAASDVLQEIELRFRPGQLRDEVIELREDEGREKERFARRKNRLGAGGMLALIG